MGWSPHPRLPGNGGCGASTDSFKSSKLAVLKCTLRSEPGQQAGEDSAESLFIFALLINLELACLEVIMGQEEKPLELGR